VSKIINSSKKDLSYEKVAPDNQPRDAEGKRYLISTKRINAPVFDKAYYTKLKVAHPPSSSRISLNTHDHLDNADDVERRAKEAEITETRKTSPLKKRVIKRK
jgi:hypothetical protein